MYYSRLKTPVIALAIWYAAAALTLVAPNSVIAKSSLPRQEMVQEVSIICPEPRQPAFAWQSARANLAGTDLHGPPHVARLTQPAETVRAELQVPETVLRALLTEARSGVPVELYGPEALLGSLYAEGRVQMPQRRQERCGPFFSLY
jgi:hypothetical protein